MKDEGHRMKDKIDSTLKLIDEGNKSFIFHPLSFILHPLSFILTDDTQFRRPADTKNVSPLQIPKKSSTFAAKRYFNARFYFITSNYRLIIH